MANTTKRPSLETKTALSQIVLPKTMDDIEEFLKPQFPPRNQRRKIREQDEDREEDDDQVEGRRIVMDGFGRWREVRPKKHIPSRKLQLVDSTNLSSMKHIFGMETPGSSRGSSGLNTPLEKSRYDNFKSYGEQNFREKTPKSRRGSDSSSVYNNIGMITRSNVFPGIGNYQWNTTTARTFTEQPVTPVEDRKVFFGLQTDDFGAWSAANVLNERMKKAWGEYQESVPKAKANWEQQPPTTEHAKPPPAPKQPKTKPKKNPPKPKTKQDNIVTDDTSFQEPENPPSKPHPPPPYVPDDGDTDNGNDFWDFFDKPFNKPQR